MAEVTSHPPGAFCWVELGTSDANAAKDFYTKLFGWSFTDNDMGPGGVYTIFKLKGRDVAAGYKLDPVQMPGVPPHWMLYVATADADASARRASEQGGSVKAPPFDVMDFGRMAVLSDPQGGAFCVWQAKANTGIGIHNEPGAFCWGQLNTTDTAKAEAFYKGLFGWAAKTGSDGGMTYTEWLLGGTPIGGMMEKPKERAGTAALAARTSPWPTATRPRRRPPLSARRRTCRRRTSRAWGGSPSSRTRRGPRSPSTRSEKKSRPGVSISGRLRRRVDRGGKHPDRKETTKCDSW